MKTINIVFLIITVSVTFVIPFVKFYLLNDAENSLYSFKFYPFLLFFFGFLLIPMIKRDIKKIENKPPRKLEKWRIVLLILTIAITCVYFFYSNNRRSSIEDDDFEEWNFRLMTHPQKSMDSTNLYWKPDTILYQKDNMPYKREINIFNKQEQVAETLYQEYNNTVWVTNNRRLFLYDTNGMYTLVTYQKWENNSWINDSRESYNYNNANKLLSELSQKWKENKWEYSFTTYYSYNNGLVEKEITKEWHKNKWQDHRKRSYQYDQNQRLVLEEVSSFFDGAWDNPLKDFYTYDSNNNIQTKTRVKSNGFSNSTERDSIVYNKLGNPILQIWQTKTKKGWVNKFQYSCNYDSVNRKTICTFQVWEKNVFKNFVKEDFLHDENGNEISAEFWKWDNEAECWLPDSKNCHRLYYNNTKDYIFASDCQKVTVSYSIRKK